MKSFIVAILVLTFFIPHCLKAQEVDRAKHDSIAAVLSVPDSIGNGLDIKIDTSSIRLKAAFKPSPKKAIIYSAICPGLGQIYNRKYWKLPIVYGAFLGCAYGISWNGNQYNGYKKAYSDWTDQDPATNSWASYVIPTWNKNPNTWSSDQKNWFGNMLKNKKDYYRRYRDLSYIITVGVYALTMIDAYVDAQLFDFDITPDLSMHVEPVVFDRSSISNTRSVGLQCSFSF